MNPSYSSPLLLPSAAPRQRLGCCLAVGDVICIASVVPPYVQGRIGKCVACYNSMERCVAGYRFQCGGGDDGDDEVTARGTRPGF